jgi:hypothetical protein
MKSERRSTPEVRMRRSRGGLSCWPVKVWEVRVARVMSSGEGYVGCEAEIWVGSVEEWGGVVGVGEANMEVVALGEEGSVVSGWRVVEDEMVEYDSPLEREEAREVVLEVGDWRPGGWR